MSLGITSSAAMPIQCASSRVLGISRPVVERRSNAPREGLERLVDTCAAVPAGSGAHGERAPPLYWLGLRATLVGGGEGRVNRDDDMHARSQPALRRRQPRRSLAKLVLFERWLFCASPAAPT